ncbi:MAG: leucyl aminopeptidase [Candidatus Omnitrophica bacterium]|nr:leucyl aminopeptidase [Candidatus Omnitrophota bacterium]
MKLHLIAKSKKRTSSEIFIAGIFKNEKISKELQQLETELAAIAAKALEEGRITGKFCESFSFYNPSYREAHEIVLLGLGSRSDYRAKCLRKAVGHLVKMLTARKVKKARLLLSSFTGGENSLADVIEALAEVGILASYTFDKYKSKKEGEAAPQEIILEGILSQGSPEAFQKKIKDREAVAGGVIFARDLINEPANVMNPQTMAQAARDWAHKKKLKCQILEKDELEKLGMNGILAVNSGSVTPPAFVILEHGSSHASKGTVCLIGKGVTFDTGGISIKPSKDMEKMKYDMSGAAAVIGAMGVIADLKLPVHVVGLTPLVENNVAADPHRPGDIIKMFNGKTVEIINTDAEGRLILADALAYAAKYKPKAILDAATLTGMARATFDNHAIAILGNDERLLAKVKKAGEETGERCWPLPMWDEYLDSMKGNHSDLLNSGSGFAGTITAAKFLQEFVPEKTPWVHLDIAGVAWCDSPRYDAPKGAYGAAVRLFVNFLLNW